MKKLFDVLIALWEIACWWNSKEEKKQVKREELKKETADAIKTGDTKKLDRILSDL